MGETSKKYWTASVLLLGTTGFALSVLGADDQTVGGFATVATVLGVVVALRSKFDKPTGQPEGEEDSAQHQEHRSEVAAGDPYGRWWRQARG
ncbi:hypothetical protein I2485_03490 [Nesterenkonia sp. E16_7]|uniref:hypothetical protein n=1 Tax=unclassified Nesterenkonia TaxID=2629769 RepID=UPI001A923748|nr:MULTISPECIES: hypothetical protein [unclassified Nesterenkonia]MBO0594265.1 hypothetical protein [Nesterenkonia sp. E16_10]MBO0597710.1 hypothetical protein [Nesterenkonia sp. E16_7]